jgi:hypothetical protein
VNCSSQIAAANTSRAPPGEKGRRRPGGAKAPRLGGAEAPRGLGVQPRPIALRMRAKWWAGVLVGSMRPRGGGKGGASVASRRSAPSTDTVNLLCFSGRVLLLSVLVKISVAIIDVA